MTQILKIPKLEYAGFTDDEFFEFCMANEGLKFERNSKRETIIMPLTSYESGVQESNFGFHIQLWNHTYKKGFVFSSQTGFTLPNDAIRSPDCAWISTERHNNISLEERKKFAHVVPDFVAEIKSYSDSWKGLQLKMVEYMENGVQLGWLINPFDKKVMIYTPENVNPIEQDFGIITGGKVLIGLEIDLRTVFQEIL
ncbi:MAG: Uma2 family endonuclease [Bacteroidota bacterium]